MAVAPLGEPRRDSKSRPQLTDADLARLLRNFSDQYFFGQLGEIAVKFRWLEDADGIYDSVDGIMICWDLNDDPETAEKTLLHEMVHAFLEISEDPCSQRRNDPHGAAFAAQIRRLQAAGANLDDELEWATCSSVDPVRLARAADHYFNRKAGRDDPKGAWDRRGFWRPSDREKQVCCEGLSPGGKHFKSCLRQHCRSISHISRLHAVDTVSLRKLVAVRRPTRRPNAAGEPGNMTK